MSEVTSGSDQSPEPSAGRVDVLDWAATLLLAASCADPMHVRSTVRLPCLQAAERLRVAGARPKRSMSRATAAQLRDVLRAAVSELESLSPDLMALTAVQHALAAARDAVAELG
jgi:hypothetical protein